MQKREETPRVVLFRGEDDFQKEREVDELVRSLVSEDFADFDLERLEGDSVTSERLMSGLNNAPMGSGRRVLVVKHAQKMPKEEQEQLAAKLESLPKSCCLILVNPAPQKTDGRPKKGTEVIGELSKSVRKVGVVRDCGGGQKREKEAAARRFAQSLFEQAGKKAVGQTLTVMIRRVGADMHIVASEAEKLIAYAGDADTITAEDVEQVTSETPEEKVYKLVDAVGAKNQPAALKLLDELFEASGDPKSAAPRTLSLLAKQFRLIWQMNLLLAAGVRDIRKGHVPEDIRNQLPSDPNLLDILSRQSWRHEKIARQASGFDRNELGRCLLAVARADRMLKGIEGGIEDPRVVMELLVIELAARPQAFAERSPTML